MAKYAEQCLRRVVVVLVFPRATPALLHAHWAPGVKVIAVDGGADILMAAGVLPDLVVGDLDSVGAEALAWLEKNDIAIERHPEAKRDSDAALAVARVPPDEDILFIGASGGRPDHALANLHLLAAAAGRARAIDEDAAMWVVSPSRPLQLDLPMGAIVSVLPFDVHVTGVTYTNLQYALTDAEMRAGDPYGISNRATGGPVTIRVTAGRLIVVVPRDDRPE